MGSWILIAYLGTVCVNGIGEAGGPVTAGFVTKEQCEQAGAAIKDKWPWLYGGHICAQTAKKTVW